MASIGLGQFIAELKRATFHTRIPVAELVGFFSASAEPEPATANAPQPVAPKPRAAKKRKKSKLVEKPPTLHQRRVKEGLLEIYPEGTLDGWKEMLRRLDKEKNIRTSRATLARVLRQMPKGWRKAAKQSQRES